MAMNKAALMEIRVLRNYGEAESSRVGPNLLVTSRRKAEIPNMRRIREEIS